MSDERADDPTTVAIAVMDEYDDRLKQAYIAMREVMELALYGPSLDEVIKSLRQKSSAYLAEEMLYRRQWS